MGTVTLYRNFRIRRDPPPIPVRTMDWQAVHEDYDPTPQYSYDGPSDNRVLFAGTPEDIIRAVDEWHEENADA